MSALKTEVEAKFASTFFCCFHRTSNTDEQRVQSRCGRVEANSAIYFSEV